MIDRMSGRRQFGELTKDFTPERRRRVDDKQELLKVNQPAVSKLEQRADVYVSSLRSYIDAVGGRLKMVAEFPEGDVFITNFYDAGDFKEAV